MARILERHTLNTRISIENPLTGQALGELVNITTEGMMIISSHSIAPHTTLQLHLALTEPILGENTIALTGECLWCKQTNEKTHYWAGFQFTDASEMAIQQLDIFIDTLSE